MRFMVAMRATAGPMTIAQGDPICVVGSGSGEAHCLTQLLVGEGAVPNGMRTLPDGEHVGVESWIQRAKLAVDRVKNKLRVLTRCLRRRACRYGNSNVV